MLRSKSSKVSLSSHLQRLLSEVPFRRFSTQLRARTRVVPLKQLEVSLKKSLSQGRDPLKNGSLGFTQSNSFSLWFFDDASLGQPAGWSVVRPAGKGLVSPFRGSVKLEHKDSTCLLPREKVPLYSLHKNTAKYTAPKHRFRNKHIL